MVKFKSTGSKRTPSRKRSHDSLEAMRTRFPSGTIIFSEGDLGLTMYVIESGEVEITKRIAGKDRVLAKLGKGDFFGEMCMLEDSYPRAAAAAAVTDDEAVIIDQSAFTRSLSA
jgi:CRP-like cAMP-binding protein